MKRGEPSLNRAACSPQEGTSRLIVSAVTPKTGQSRTLQNPPVDRTQNNLVLHYGRCADSGLHLNLLDMCHAVYTDFPSWAEGTATQGCDRSTDSAAGKEERRNPLLRRVIQSFWRESAKSQEFRQRPQVKQRSESREVSRLRNSNHRQQQTTPRPNCGGAGLVDRRESPMARDAHVGHRPWPKLSI